MKILVTGVTGYVGSRLVPKLLEAGHEVVCMLRDRSHLELDACSRMRVVQADALDPETLPAALEGVDVAYYLIHSMAGKEEGFAARDDRAAGNFATVAKQAGLARIVYLGGLTSQVSEVSPHLKSREKTGQTLRQLGPPLTEFRTGIIVGNGSVSFEMIRCLADRLPVMICPRWVATRTQPIAIDDVIEYLAAALKSPESIGQIIEIGGSSIETYRSMMLTYARIRGLRRWLIRVPVLTPRLSSYWLNLVTPIPASIARPLIEGLRTEVICTDPRAKAIFPQIRPVSYEAAVEETLKREIPDETFTAKVPANAAHVSVRREGLICDIRQALVNATAEQIFGVLRTLGGKSCWLYANWLWQLRGWIDLLAGGVGMRRVPARDSLPKIGDHVDFWQIQEIIPPFRLLLQADMKLPGRAWLQFVLSPQDDGRTRIRCCAWFEPRGLAGEAYWWMLYPVHALIFRGMLKAIQRRCEKTPGNFAKDCRLVA